MPRRRPDGSVIKKSRGIIGGKECVCMRYARADATRPRSGVGTNQQEEESSITEQQSKLQLVWSQQTTTPAQTKAAGKMGDWAKTASKKRRSASNEKDAKAATELESMIDSGEWDTARPIHMVVLYCVLHEKVYGVEALDLRGQLNRQAASRMVLTMLQRDFERDPEAMVEYLRWSWVREESREVWRRRNNTGRRRLTWRMQFGPELLTEYLMQRVSDSRG